MLKTKLTADNLAKLARREPFDTSLLSRVDAIVTAVRNEGDAAVLRFTSEFDGFSAGEAAKLRVSVAEMAASASRVDSKLREALLVAARRIRDFHERQRPGSWFVSEDGSFLGQKVTPIDRAGLYVPGGRASYPSTVLMNAIPAQVAGVKEIAMCTPAGPDGSVSDAVLAAASIVGVSEIYKIGGAQAVAAMAFGTGTVPRVDKITGPGNIYVTLAKKLVVGEVGIDMLAGPSEVLIVADAAASARLVALDMLAQAEHDPLAAAILVTTSDELAQKVENEIKALLPTLARKEIAASSLLNQGKMLVCETVELALEFVNAYAPEHLELMLEDAFSYLGLVRNAGAIFLGPDSCEALGDYVAGANHTLPTSGTARFSSSLGVEDFIKRSSVISLSADMAAGLAEPGQTIASVEGLSAHAESMRARAEKKEPQ